jgi:hypothetical protein
MVSWVLTAPQDLDENDYKKFFEEGFNFFNNKYGVENCVSAYVHMDETTPHIHYAFVPVVKDKKRGDLKVSAKELITKSHLQRFHHELDEHMTKYFGRDVGVFTEITKENGNKEISELKMETLKNNIETKENTLSKLSKSVINTKKELNKYEILKKQTEIDYLAKKGYLQSKKDHSEIGNPIPSYAKINKSNILRKEETITIPKNEWDKYVNYISEEEERLRDMREVLEKDINNFKKTIDTENIIKLQEEIKILKKDLKMKDSKKNIAENKYDTLVERYSNLVKENKIEVMNARKEGVNQGIEKSLKDGENKGSYDMQLKISRNILKKFSMDSLIEFKNKAGKSYFEYIGLSKEISQKAYNEFIEIQKKEKEKLEIGQQKLQKKKSIGMSL